MDVDYGDGRTAFRHGPSQAPFDVTMAVKTDLGAGEMGVTIKREFRKKCFISAPYDIDLSVLRKALNDRGVSVLVPQDLTVGTNFATRVREQILQASLVIGVISQRPSSEVLFEIGFATALDRQVLIIAPPSIGPIPPSLQQMLVLRVEPNNLEAIGFALDQVLSAPEKKGELASIQTRSQVGLGSKVDELIQRLDRSLAIRDWGDVQKIITIALKSSGVDVVAESPYHDKGADFAVWSDVLESFVGNPLIIEVKPRIRDSVGARSAVRQTVSYINASSAQWGLLLYGDGPVEGSDWWDGAPPNVLILSLRSFLAQLRTSTFPEIVRDLRNRRVHGSLF